MKIQTVSFILLFLLLLCCTFCNTVLAQSRPTVKENGTPLPTYAQLQRVFEPILIPGQNRCLFTIYGAPSDVETLKQLVSVMKSKPLGIGFDPGPRPTPNSSELNDYLGQLGWPIVTYPGDMQFKYGRDSISDEEETIRHHLDEKGAVTYVQLGEWGYYFHRLSYDKNWLRDNFGADTSAYERYAELAPPNKYAGYSKRPQSRAECYAELKDYFDNRNQAFRGRTISINGHSHYEAYVGEWGAAIIGLELGENIAFTQSKMAFARGASRCWGKPWSIQVSPWLHGDCTTSGPLRGKKGEARGLDAGHSLSFYERLWLHAWFAGTAIVTPENSIDSFFEDRPNRWTTNERGENVADWKLTSHGERGREVFQFMESHDRGIPHTPIVIVLDHLAGYNPYTGKTFGYLERSEGDWHIYDLLEEQLFPGSDHIHKYSDRANPEKFYMRPTPFGESFDVVLSKATASLLKNYPVILLVGDQAFEDSFVDELEKSLIAGSQLLLSPDHAQQLGSRLERLQKSGTVEVLERWNNPITGRNATISNDRLAELVAHYQPIQVSGSPVEYQINRNQSGWVVELINNEGVAKQGNLPVQMDDSKVAKVVLTPKFTPRQITEWRCGEPDVVKSVEESSVSVENSVENNVSFEWTILVGKTLFVEFAE